MESYCGGPFRYQVKSLDMRRCWILSMLVFWLGGVALESGVWAEPVKPALEAGVSPVIRVNLDEALGLFLSQNFEVMVRKYGIESAKAKEMTASLFPNPESSFGLRSVI